MWLYNRHRGGTVRMVVSGGQDPSREHRTTPLGVCDRVLQGKQSFYNGKRLRMGHYAVILQLRFRLNLKGYQLASKWLTMSV